MRRITVWALAAALFPVGGLSAQEKPNFSGEWTVTSPDGPTGFCGQQCTITQDATSLTVTRMTQAGQQKSIFKLDGSESEIAVTGGRGRGGVVTRAMWDGNKLRISSQAPTGLGGTGSIVLSMNAGQMEVETSITVGDSEPRRSKQTYQKN